MAGDAIFIGWGDPVHGRELKGLEVFGEAVALWGRLQQEGAIESFEPVLLGPHGGDLQGFLAQHEGTAYEDDAMLFLGESQLQAGQATEAVATLEQLLDEHANSQLADNARRLLAAAYAQAGQFDEAITAYREAIETTPYEPLKIQIHESLAQLFASQSRNEEAVAEYQAILELQPEGPAADEARREIAELTVQPLTSAPAESAAP